MGASLVARAMNANVSYPAFNPKARRELKASARDQLRAQTEHLAWGTYLSALRLQKAEPGPISTAIRNATYQAWKQVFMAEDSGAQP